MLFTIRLTVLALWLGAMAAFAFLFAPIAFAHIGPTPGFAAAVADTLRLLTRCGAACGSLAVAITIFASDETPRVRAAIVGMLALTIALGLVETNFIIPAMATTPLRTAAYDALHQRSGTLYAAIMAATLVAFILSSRRAYR